MTLEQQAPRLRGRIERTFTDTIVIKERSATADTEGNASGTLTTLATIEGRLSKPTPTELQVAAQAGQRLDRVLTVAYDADVEPGQVVEVNGERWKVGTVASSRVQTKVNLSRWEG